MYKHTIILIMFLLGACFVQAGTLTINNGATLNGSGNLIGDVIANTGGTVAPTTGCLSVSNATFTAGSNLSITVGGNFPCTGYSQLQVNGVVDLGQAILQMTTSGYSLQVGDEFIVVDNDAFEAIIDTFNSLPEDSTFILDGELLYASYLSGDGNDASLVYKFVYSVGGVVNGLATGNEITLQNNGSDDVIVNSNSSYTFPTDLDDGSNYNVTLVAQPSTPNQTCVIDNAMGTLSGANITNVNVNCTTNTYAIGGVVAGLATGTTVTLQNNTGDDLVINANGAFVFPIALNDQSNYSVTVSVQPNSPNQVCQVTNGSGVLAGASISNVEVNCETENYTIGGNVAGLAPGNSVTIQNNATDDLLVNANGTFVFSTAQDDGDAFDVTVLTQPTTPNQTCTVNNGSGNLAGGNEENVDITCVTNTYFIGGSLTGLLDGNMLIIQNNNTDDLMITQDGPFAFFTPLDDESNYAVTVDTQPVNPNQNCTLSNENGQLNGDDVIDVDISCDNLDLIFKDGFEVVPVSLFQEQSELNY